jgi:predicted HTH domain antitoxin
MGFNYDISKDYLYNEGRKQAEKEITRKVAVRMLEGTTFSIEKIAEILGVTTDYVKQVEKDLKR